MYSTVIETQISFTVGTSCVWLWHHIIGHIIIGGTKKKKKKERNRRRMDPEYYVLRSISRYLFFSFSPTPNRSFSPHLSTNLSVNKKELFFLFFFFKEKGNKYKHSSSSSIRRHTHTHRRSNR